MLARLREAVLSAVYHGQITWATSRLRDRDHRFDEVWESAGRIPGWFDEVVAVSIFQILCELRPTRIVEIGSFMGKSTVFFGKALQVLGIDGRVLAIDPHSGDRQQREGLGNAEIATFEMFRTSIRAAGVGHLVDAIVSSSHEASKDWTTPFEFLFVDGWHSYDAVLADGRD